MAPKEMQGCAVERGFAHYATQFGQIIGAKADGCAIVGVGASAGGLAAFAAFFSAMRAESETGMAFVLVQHLAPDHESTLAELISRASHLQVLEAEDGMRVEPNTAYIIPPNRNLTLLKGTLQLSAQAVSRGRCLPIDFFFRSLARAQRDRAVGIVLSGTGTDGTLGVRAIKAEGGIVIVQTPESTEYDGMPRSAIATGLVDHVLRPSEMPAQLVAYAGSLSGRGRRPSVPPPLEVQNELEKIVRVLYAHTGHDFSQYKKNTIRRRVERRMTVQHIAQLRHYCRFLEDAPTEIEDLLRDLLIGVTSFFRDPKAFAALETEVIARLVDNRSSGCPIRAWVPGCSTGEEAYSIAILLREKADIDCPIQIFGTDIDPRAIEHARAGVYSASIASHITPARLARYFSRTESGDYCVHESIRSLLTFAEQDVTHDPPFSGVDLISCRNLMIYMAAELQQKLIPLFHYALNPDGALFLGTSETVGEFVDLFTPTERQAKLYQRKDDANRRASLPLGRDRAAAEPGGKPHSARARRVSEFPKGRLEHCLEVSARPPAEEARIVELTQALRAKEECFHAAREEMQTSNEEFRASIEELQSTNERLQSTNEQLETSKDQIQSMNEQLTTLNAKLQSKMTELAHVNDDPRPLQQVVSPPVCDDSQLQDSRCVLGHVTPATMDVQTKAAARYCRQVRPCAMPGDVVQGVVLPFSEVSIADTPDDFEKSADFACKERRMTN